MDKFSIEFPVNIDGLMMPAGGRCRLYLSHSGPDIVDAHALSRGVETRVLTSGSSFFIRT